MRLNERHQSASQRRRLRAVLVALALISVGSSQQASAQRPPIEKAKLELATDRSAYLAGGEARIAATIEVDPGWHIQSNTPSFDYLIPTQLELRLPSGWAEAKIEYPDHIFWSSEFEEEPLAVFEGTTNILASVVIPKGFDRPVGEVEARLRYQACDERTCLPPTEATANLRLSIGEEGELQHTGLFTVVGDDTQGPGGDSAQVDAAGLLSILALGLLGGVILNAMPCVLPVLSLKLFGLVQKAGKGRRSVVIGGLATSAGILVSFWILAILAIVARAAGGLVGWGIQFQNPTFVTLLVIVVVLFCLNLWGIFEVPLPRRLAQFGDGGTHDGVLGHFATGLFATLMATPCSAPFLGTAVGFGLSQSGGTILAVFTAIAIGMSAPYLALAAAPGSVSWLPKPGMWMMQLKMTMGFLLAGAAVWLLYVLAAQVRPERVAFIEVGLLVLALFVWLTATSSSVRGRVVARVGSVAAIIATLALSGWGGQVSAGVAKENVGLIGWSEFDRSEAEALAEQGKLVFVDVTADWCFTCKVNERLVLETQEVADAFAKHDVVPMRADWTNRNDEIATLLADFGRYSVPFYLLYRPGLDPHLFPELLRQRQILEVLSQSDSGKASVANLRK